MAATTISRATWTDGAAPTGTLINNARLQADIYDKIDAIFAGAVTFGGVVGSEAFGTHSFTAGGTGGNSLRVRNTSAGTGNQAQLVLGNDASATLGYLVAYSSTYTSSGMAQANGISLQSIGSGGMWLGTNSAHALRLCANGTAYLTVESSGDLTFAGTTIAMSSANPVLSMNESDASANNKYWRFIANGEQLILQAGNDALSAFGGVWSVDRTGSTIDSFNVGTHCLPSVDDSYNLGSASLAWNRLFLADGSAATPTLTAGNDSNTGVFFQASGVADTVGITTGGTERAVFSGGGLSVTGAVSASANVNCTGVLPNSDNLYDLGGVSDRWNDVYATNGTIQTSDRRLKTDIAPSPYGLAFLRGLQPVQYRWQRPGRKGAGRLHLGLIAQDVLATDAAVSNYGLVIGAGTDAAPYGMRYTELIAPLIAAVQELAARLEAVEAR